MLQHDNVPSHSSFLARDFLAKHTTTVLPKLKSTLKGRCFESIEAIKTNSLAHLCCVPKKAFLECFRTLKKRWQRCIQSRGEYIECDKAEQLQGKTGKFLCDIFGNFPDGPRICVKYFGVANIKFCIMKIKYSISSEKNVEYIYIYIYIYVYIIFVFFPLHLLLPHGKFFQDCCYLLNIM